MKLPLFCALMLLAIPAVAAPVRVSLKPTASALPNADGFLTLGTVASITGGDKAARARFSAVPVARAPLSGETRRLTRGDLSLKLRQAGINPDTQAVLEGADSAEVTTDCPPALQSAPLLRGPILGSHTEKSHTEPVGALLAAPSALSVPQLAIHSGDAVTILIQSGAMTITAPATARENGRVGDTIRVQRPGISADLPVQVLDTQTVQMEI